MPYLEQMVQGVKELGLEACMTLGTLDESQAQRLANAAQFTPGYLISFRYQFCVDFFIAELCKESSANR